MTWHRNVLVVANLTAMSDELVTALSAKTQVGETTFTMVVPASGAGGRAAAREQLDAVLTRMREAGLTIDGDVGDSDPIVAVKEVWNPARYDEIVVCTLPMQLSKWLHAGLPERLAEVTGAPVTHVIAHPPRPATQPVPAPPQRVRLGPLLAPFAAVGRGTYDRPDASHRRRVSPPTE